MRDRRAFLLGLGIPALLVFGTLAAAQLRSARAMDRFTRLQKAFPPDSLGRTKAKPEVEQKKAEALALAERLAPDNPDIVYQTALMHLVRAETQSLQGDAGAADGESGGESSGPGERLRASLREGLRRINRAIVLNPGVAEYHFVKATLLQNLAGTGDEAAGGTEGTGTSEAVAALLRLSDRLDPYRPSLHYRLGSFWLALGEQDAARGALSVALSDSYRYARPVFDLLWSSVEDVGELDGFVGDEPLSRALLGDFLWMHGYRAEAQIQFEKVQKAPWLDYRTGEALLAHYLREHEGERAREVISRLEKQHPPFSAFHQARLKYFRGRSFLRENRFGEAIASYEQSLALDPSVIQSHLDLASAYLEDGDPHKAIARWRYVLTRGVEVPRGAAAPGEIHYGLGRAYEALGDRDRALDEYLRASSEDPANPAFSRKAAEITRGL